MCLGDFSEQAAAYRLSRPGYPADLLDRIVALADLSPDDSVAEVGAGTGIFTSMLAERGFRVTALEPNAAMRRLAPDLPGVTWSEGTFEATGLPDQSQRWVVAAQAFHWADPRRGLPEIRRVLEPGGAFTVLWNNRDSRRSDVLAWVDAAISRHVPEFDHAYRDANWGGVLTCTGDFSRVVYGRAEHCVRMSRERFLELWRSHNKLNVTAGPQRFEAFLREVADYLGARELSDVAVPYICEAWTAF